MQPSFDAHEFRRALGNFLTGVTIVCTRDQAVTLRGFTANSFTSVSLSPPLVLVCLAKSSSNYDAFRVCASFSVNVLSESQKPISMQFATRSADRFKDVAIGSAATGAPILSESLSWMDCLPFDRIDAGDHLVLIGQVVALGIGKGSPLGYWNGGYVTPSLEAAATRVEVRASAYVGCVLDRVGKVLLCRDENGRWSVPLAPLRGSRRNHEERLNELLISLGLQGRPSFLYSVFEAAGQGTSYIVYRAELLEDPPVADPAETDHSFFAQADLPRDAIWCPEGLNMLDRYYRERAVARFGIYSDAGQQGSVVPLGSDPIPWQEAFAR